MASVSTSKQGVRRVVFVTGNGERKAIYIGKLATRPSQPDMEVCKVTPQEFCPFLVTNPEFGRELPLFAGSYSQTWTLARLKKNLLAITSPSAVVRVSVAPSGAA